MNTQKFTIGTQIRTILLNDTVIQDKLKNNIFPIVAPENTQGDFIVYTRDKYSKQYTNMGIYIEECVVFVSVVCSDYDDSQQLAIAVNNALEGYSNEGFEIKMTDSSESFAEEKYIQTLQFTID